MTGRIFLLALAAGALAFAGGWYLRDVMLSAKPDTNSEAVTTLPDTIPKADTIKTRRFANTLSGHFLLAGANCAGFHFKGGNTTLWTNELFCNSPDTFKMSWISDSVFMTRSTLRRNEECPPLVDIYKIVSFDGKRLTLENIWTGWNDSEDETLRFEKQPD